jgi:transcription antitermination factor NusG
MNALNSVIQHTANPSVLNSFVANQTAVANDELHWYAVYTRSRHEKVVKQQLDANVPECFLPLYEAVRRWKNGNALVASPLFPGYLFVRISSTARKRVLATPGVVRLVGSRRGPEPIPDQELDAFRNCFERQIRMEPHPYLAVGRRVRLESGPFAGMQGILLRKKGKWRLIISINLIARSVAVEVDANDVAPLPIAQSLTGSNYRADLAIAS